MEKILHETRFLKKKGGWNRPSAGRRLEPARGKTASLEGPGVHTRNGDSIELAFSLPKGGMGALRFGFRGGMEAAVVRLDFKAKRATLETTDWTVPQPEASVRFRLKKRASHVLRLEKREGRGTLVRMADITAVLDGETLFVKRDVDVLPEIGVAIEAVGMPVLLKRFVQRGVPTGIPEYLRVGAWQVSNKPDIKANLSSICRGIREAAEKRVRLLVTPETCLTGLFPWRRVTKAPGPVAEAEKRLRACIRRTRNAPWVIVGLPVWESVPGHERKRTRYNVSRLYDPDGAIAGTYPKIHSCEPEFMHGYRLAEFDVGGCPVTMHICHDARYPDVYTLPVMFGARLVLHPANGGKIGGAVDSFLARLGGPTMFSNTFYVHVNGEGGSYIVGCRKFDNTIVVSEECRRNVSTYPKIGEPVECLIQSRLRIHDAYGYWPVRSFRVSEEVAGAYYRLYKAMGGKQC